MADNVQWIKLKVGMFDGNSFKKIKRAKIGGVSYRDKLTSVWFELLDLAGKSNANGYLIDNNEIPYHTYEDIAVMLDREEKEIELCMQFFINEKMVEIIDDIYCLTNFMQYQNQDGLAKIREQNRERQARFREKKKNALLLAENNVTDNVTSRDFSLSNSTSSKSQSNSISTDTIEERKKEDIYKSSPSSKKKVKSHAEIMQEWEIDDRLRYELEEFLRHCHLNGRTVTNDKLNDIILRLYDYYGGGDIDGMCEAVRIAIRGGYFDIAEYHRKNN